jgi:DNA-binding transcriptional ArsR family regulator
LCYDVHPMVARPHAMSGGVGAEDQLWAAVGEPSRRRVLDVLLARGEATPTMLAAELPFSRQAVTKHLAVLDRAGLVEGRRLGREVRYVVRPERLAVAADSMTRVAARWDERLVAIKRVAEAAHSDQVNPNQGERPSPR